MKNLKKFEDLKINESKTEVIGGDVEKIRITSDNGKETVDVIDSKGYITIIQKDNDGMRRTIFIEHDMVDELCKTLKSMSEKK